MAATGPIIPALEVTRTYPRTVEARDQTLVLRAMTAGDEESMLEFARGLPAADLLFLPMDITRPEVVAEWVRSIESGRRFTVLAEDQGRLAGYCSLNRQDVEWSRHLGEIRMIVSPAYRGTGLGGILAREILEIARGSGLTKIVAQMPRDQEGARGVFRKLGFNLESMLAEWVIDREGQTHDLVVMAYDLSE